jgi:hypothetical protein
LTVVALSFLVYQRSGSPLLAALTFAGSQLTWVLGGPLLSVVADRLPRRTVLLGADLIRAAMVLLMLVPGTPAPLLVAIAFVANLCRPPFQSARSSLLPDLLDGDRYPVANGLDNIVAEVTQVAGFALGGLLVTAGSAQLALGADAATFVVSALLIATGLRRCDPATRATAEPSGSWWSETTAGVRVVFADRTLRSYLLLFWLSCVVYGTEGVVAPLAAEYGGGARTTGLLLAMMPAGVAIGGVLLTRFCPPDLRTRLMAPLAVLSCAVLLPVAAHPPLPVVLVLLFVSGLAGAFSIPLNSLFGRAVPAAYRARAFGVAMSGLCAIQGLAMLGAGAAAETLRPSTVVGGAGLLATLAVLTVLATSARPARVAASPESAPRVAASPESATRVGSAV